MTRSVATLARAACAAATISALGCADGEGARTMNSGTATRAITPQVAVRVGEDRIATVTLSLDRRGDVGPIGSYTGRLLFDSTTLAFKSEIDPADGTLRVTNPLAGMVRLAGISRTGVDAARIAEFRFDIRDPGGLASLVFELDELHETTRTDLKPVVRRGSAARILK